MNNIHPKDRIRQIFESTIDSGLTHTGNIDEIDFYSLLCKSTSNNQLYKIFSCNLIMFKYTYENEDSILIIFSIPASLNTESISVNQQDNKHISERIMDILKIVEECFITVDYMDLKNIKEEKFLYMVIVKKLKDNE